MKKLTIAAVAAFALATGSASAADLVTKAKPIVAPEPPAWDLAFGSAIASDYIFRGVTQSNHKPSVAAYFEPRYNINKDNQLYARHRRRQHRLPEPRRGVRSTSTAAGVRPSARSRSISALGTTGIRAGSASPPVPTATTSTAPERWRRVSRRLPNGNAIKKDLSFYEVYGKVNYTVNDNIALGAYVYYSPSVLNSGADGVFFGGTAKYTWAAFANGVQPYISGEVGHWIAWHHRSPSTASPAPVLCRRAFRCRTTPPGTSASAGPGRCSRSICATSTPT